METPAWRAELDERIRRKLSGRTIVLAATEDDVIDVFVPALERCGIVVEVARTANAARDAAMYERVAVVLLRLTMPQIAGRQLLGFLRIRATADTPIIALRRRGDPRVGRRDLEEARVDRILNVPCQESELLALLDAYWPEPK